MNSQEIKDLELEVIIDEVLRLSDEEVEIQLAEAGFKNIKFPD